MDDAADSCANCGAMLSGRYCASCGQMRLVEGDRRFGHLVAQFLRAATDLDSRFWGSLRALLFRPGRLSRDYFDGRRRRWMSPIALFLLANVAYFFVPANTDFDLDFDDQVPGRIVVLARDPDSPADASAVVWGGQLHSAFTAPMVDRRVAARDGAARARSGGAQGYGYGNYRAAYDAAANKVSKALILLHVPFLALVLLLLLRDRHRYYAEHFVVALHYFTFALSAIIIVVHGLRLLGAIVPDASRLSGASDVGLLLWLGLYGWAMVRQAYDVRRLRAFAVSLVLVPALLAFNYVLYRAVQFLLTFALT